MKEWISNIAAILWFFIVLLIVLIMLPIVLLMLPDEISTIMESGFATKTSGTMFLVVFGAVFGITMLVPVFRRCFRKLPWLFPYMLILTADVAILVLGIEILNFGYTVQNDARHTWFLILMLLEIILLRGGMCYLCHKKPIRIAREEYEQ